MQTSTRVRYSYLRQQFEHPDQTIEGIRRVVAEGPFTLGSAVGDLKAQFAQLIGSRHAPGVGSATDAIKILQRAQDVDFGDEVIIAANVATVRPIAEGGATPVFVDCNVRSV